MKKIFLTGIMAAAFLVACETKKNDSEHAAESQNEEKMKDSVITPSITKDDEEFAVKMANAGMKEIELGKLAEEKGELKEVKEFGKHMVHQHKELAEELKNVAQLKNITLPDSLSVDAKSEKEELMKLKGREFDKKYMNAMVEGHKKVLSAFEKEAADTQDPNLKAFAEKGIPMIKEHLQMAETTDSLAMAENKGGKKIK